MIKRIMFCRWLALAFLFLGCGDNPADSGDTTPPARVVDLEVTAVSDNSVTLAWTAPGDDGNKGQAAEYILRYAHASIYVQWQTTTRVDSLPAPRPAGARETFRVTGLGGGGDYFFALATFDEAMNRSEVSNWARANTDDVTPPAQITDLSATVISHKCVELAWTAPGDDEDRGTASSYEVRYVDGPILEPYLSRTIRYLPDHPAQTAGSAESLRLDFLNDETTYTFTLRTWDDGPNVSPLSNVVTVTTPADDTPPAAISDLAVVAVTGNGMTLGWTTPGDDGDEDRAFGYNLRFSTAPLTAETWAAASIVANPPGPGAPGSRGRVEVTELIPGTFYYFGLRTRDERGNEAPISNIATGVFELPSDGVWHVRADGSGDAPTIQAAVDMASSGDMILVGPGTYGDPFDYGGKDLIIESTDGAEATILQAADYSGEAFIRVGPGTTRSASLTGFIIAGAPGGQALFVDGGGLTLSRCNLRYNKGRALKVAGGTVAVLYCEFTENGGFFGSWPWPGAINVHSTPTVPAAVTIEHSTISGNKGVVGPALVCEGKDVELIFRHNRVQGNWSSGSGGAVRIAWSIGYALIDNNRFGGNDADGPGGALTLWHTTGGRVDVRRNLFIENMSSETGAAISLRGLAGVVENNTFVKNRSSWLDCGRATIFVEPFYLDDPQSWDWDIRRNILASNRCGAIRCTDALDGIRVADNLFFENGTCPEILCTLATRRGNITADPRFCNLITGDYRVAADSPALTIGAGAYLTPGCPATGGSASVWSLPVGTRR